GKECRQEWRHGTHECGRHTLGTYRLYIPARCSMTEHADVRRVVEAALAEDIGRADITTDSCIPGHLRAEARFVAKQSMVVAGVEVLAVLFDDVELKKRSGERAVVGDEIAVV